MATMELAAVLIAGAGVIIAAAALVVATRTSKAARRSAEAAEGSRGEARRSATAAEDSASSARRSADASERAVQLQGDALELDRERTRSERRAELERRAARFEPVTREGASSIGSFNLHGVEPRISGYLKNVGRSTGKLSAPELRLPVGVVRGGLSATGLDEDADVMLVAPGDMAVVRFQGPEIETVRGSSERLRMTVMFESSEGALRQQLVMLLGRIATGNARQQWRVIDSETVDTGGS